MAQSMLKKPRTTRRGSSARVVVMLTFVGAVVWLASMNASVRVLNRFTSCVITTTTTAATTTATIFSGSQTDYKDPTMEQKKASLQVLTSCMDEDLSHVESRADLVSEDEEKPRRKFALFTIYIEPAETNSRVQRNVDVDEWKTNMARLTQETSKRSNFDFYVLTKIPDNVAEAAALGGLPGEEVAAWANVTRYGDAEDWKYIKYLFAPLLLNVYWGGIMFLDGDAFVRPCKFNPASVFDRDPAAELFLDCFGHGANGRSYFDQINTGSFALRRGAFTARVIDNFWQVVLGRREGGQAKLKFEAVARPPKSWYSDTRDQRRLVDAVITEPFADIETKVHFNSPWLQCVPGLLYHKQRGCWTNVHPVVHGVGMGTNRSAILQFAEECKEEDYADGGGGDDANEEEEDKKKREEEEKKRREEEDKKKKEEEDKKKKEEEDKKKKEEEENNNREEDKKDEKEDKKDEEEDKKDEEEDKKKEEEEDKKKKEEEERKKKEEEDKKKKEEEEDKKKKEEEETKAQQQ